MIQYLKVAPGDRYKKFCDECKGTMPVERNYRQDLRAAPGGFYIHTRCELCMDEAEVKKMNQIFEDQKKRAVREKPEDKSQLVFGGI